MNDPEVKSTTLISPVSPLGYPTNLLAPGQTYETVNRTIGDIPLKRAPGSWWVGFIIASLLLLMFLAAVTWLLLKGVGIWGVNIPVAWGFAIVNFVWWVGIAHAGTFISAILLLLFQPWRTAINRFTEAMTLFAVCLRGFDAVAASGAAVGFLLVSAISGHDAALAAIPESAGVGRFCSWNVFHDLIVVLVSWAGT